MERTPSASSSLCVLTKNRQISVSGEWYANRLWMAQRRFTLIDTYTHLVREPFGAVVYTRLKTCRDTRVPQFSR